MYFSRSILVAVLSLSSIVSSQLLIPQLVDQEIAYALENNMNSNLVEPSMPSLTDCLTVEKSLSLFYEYARELTDVMQRIQSSSIKSTLLVPIDKAIIALPRKPHQDPISQTPNIDPSTYTQSDNSINANVQRFVTAHIIAEEIIEPELGKSYDTLLGGHPVIFKRDDNTGEMTVDPGNVKVLKSLPAANGRIFYLDGALKY